MTDNDPSQPGVTGKVGDLLPTEIWWRDHYTWLEEQGYRLRPRYKRGWVPPWKSSFYAYRYPDAYKPISTLVMNALRVADGKFVALKKTYNSSAPYEESMLRMFGTGELAQDPHNHCIPLYDVLDVPGEPGLQLLVMPFAGNVDWPPWGTVGEAVECIRQIVEGLTFMHAHHVAHRDCKIGNIMMDPTHVFPDSFHPVRPKYNVDATGRSRTCPRTLCRPRYWLIDLGVSCLYPPEEGPHCDHILGGARMYVPEYNLDPKGLYDPFPVDVFMTGRWIYDVFTSVRSCQYVYNPRSLVIYWKYKQLRFLRPLVEDMCAEEPTQRPAMQQVLARLEKVEDNVSIWTLRARPVPSQEVFWETPARAFNHWWRQIHYVLAGAPALPRPTPSLPH